ncbi:hypothetical protein E1B28_002251 [Marasmius oreades]|uniref:DUF6593 domain-containing protein n=1 Tax=Marasmius oreades TaxID=181124 RepID=A0A9P7RMZ3_9AGAR|nr:uncharacterized protein E1B28_002251 [Marasmius oreades]KAG7086287.1 hypothetical protein E1B28_002251 [Marasmius oreades]
MNLTLSGNFLKCTYTDDNGRVVYKVHTSSTYPGNSTTISKVLPDDIPRGASENGKGSGDRFAHLARIDWKVVYSTLVRGGEETSAKTFFRREGISGALGRNRIFVGDDGREYRWLLGACTSELELNDEYKTPVAKFDRRNVGSVFGFGKKRPAVLKNFPAGEHMVDLIMLTFLYIEHVRRDD